MRAHYDVSLVARTPSASGPPTLEEVAPILGARSFWWEDRINRPGQIGCGVLPETLDTTAKTRILELDRFPCELWMHREGELVAAGPLIGYERDGFAINLRAFDLLYYLNYMVAGPDTGDLHFSNVEQFSIVKQLVDAWQALDYGHFGIDTSAITGSTGQTRDSTNHAHEPNRIFDIVTRIGARRNGFDVHVDPVTRELQLFHPRRGEDLEHVVLDARNIAEAHESVSVSADDFYTEAYAISEETIGVVGNVERRELFGRAGGWQNFNDVSEQATIDDHAGRILDEFDHQLLTVGPQLFPVEGADELDFIAGDVVTFNFDGGIGMRSLPLRVLTKRYESRQGEEKIQVGFS